MLGCFVTQKNLVYASSFFLSSSSFSPSLATFLPFIIPPMLLAFLFSFCEYYKYPFKDPQGTKDSGLGWFNSKAVSFPPNPSLWSPHNTDSMHLTWSLGCNHKATGKMFLWLTGKRVDSWQFAAHLWAFTGENLPGRVIYHSGLWSRLLRRPSSPLAPLLLATRGDVW